VDPGRETLNSSNEFPKKKLPNDYQMGSFSSFSSLDL